MNEAQKKQQALDKFKLAISTIKTNFKGYESFIKQLHPNDSSFYARITVSKEIDDYIDKLETICHGKDVDEYEYAIHMHLENLECWNIIVEAKYPDQSKFWNPLEISFENFLEKNKTATEIKANWLTTKNPSTAVITAYINSML